MVIYKSKKNIKSKVNRKSNRKNNKKYNMKKTRKNISKMRGGDMWKGDCGLIFKSYNALVKFRDYVYNNSQIRADQKKNFKNMNAQQACVNQIQANYLPSVPST
jgi:hypothetical protein